MSDSDFVRVRDVMSPKLHGIDGLASVRDAVAIMHREEVSSLVIDKRHEGDEYGMVTVQDIAREVISAGRSTERTSVYEIMTKPVLTVNVEMNVKYAIRLLARYGLTRALATDDGRMVGIVTLRDMTVKAAGLESA